VPQAIAGNYNLQLPAISGTDTLASLGMANYWTSKQTFNGGISGTGGTGTLYLFTLIGGTSASNASQYQSGSPYQITGGASTTVFTFDALLDGGTSAGYNY